jgi:hypothetical protein
MPTMSTDGDPPIGLVAACREAMDERVCDYQTAEPYMEITREAWDELRAEALQ